MGLSKRRVTQASTKGQPPADLLSTTGGFTATEPSLNGHHPAPETEVLVEPEAPASAPGQPIHRFSAYVLTDDGEELDEEPLLTVCPARQPRESDLFRVRTEDEGPGWRIKTLIVDYRGEDPAVPRGFYLIHPRLARVFGRLGKPHLLLTCVTTHGSMFIWPIHLVGPTGGSVR
jgi:hypothetical protein